MGVRDIQKQETRDRVLNAARDLFDEVGYDGATIRLVAQRAGVSVGSVFTTFSSKADILSQVMAGRLDELAAEIAALPAHGSARARIKAMMAAHYRFEMRRPNLMLAHIVAAFTPDLEAEAAPFGHGEHNVAPFAAALRDGVAAGEIDPAANIDLLIDALRGLYAWNYRFAARDAVEAERLIAACERQIDLLFDGCRPR